VAQRFGANVTLIKIKQGRRSDARDQEVDRWALGRQETFEHALRAICPGGTLSSLGVYSGTLVAPHDAFYAGLGDQEIVTTLCPGGNERMRRLMAMIEHHRVDLTPLVTHQFTLDDIEEAFDLFSHQRNGILKVALYPGKAHDRRLVESPASGARDDRKGAQAAKCQLDRANMEHEHTRATILRDLIADGFRLRHSTHWPFPARAWRGVEVVRCGAEFVKDVQASEPL
jgi:hypothetical protein